MLKRMTLSVIIGNNNKVGVGEDNIASDLHDELLATSDNAHSASAEPPPQLSLGTPTTSVRIVKGLSGINPME
ncbi:unnamed protein product [Clonostachys chloroleuca]|uniref:Uncharacterized protein n=1 Tax=Clonostachys chloroleuca TaxID=1926264 RepID=A0AA35MJQ7_9HYPO|nr:unnamed protein product [Clonostachys chloroleuca]